MFVESSGLATRVPCLRNQKPIDSRRALKKYAHRTFQKPRRPRKHANTQVGTMHLKRIFNVVPALRGVAYFLRCLILNALILQHVVQLLPAL